MHKIADIATGIIIVAGIMVMVRPNSQGPAFVKNVADGFSGAIGAATGGGGFNQKVK